MVRLFIGVPVPVEVAKATVDIQNSLSRMPMSLRLVDPKKMHLTLSFLGEVAVNQVPSLSIALDKVCAFHKRFFVKIGDLKLIPNESNFRVIAFDVKSSGSELDSLRKDVLSVIGGESHPTHLTIARVKEIKDKRFVVRVMKGVSIDKYFEVSSVCLMKSTLGVRGPLYEVLHETKLE